MKRVHVPNVLFYKTVLNLTIDLKKNHIGCYDIDVIEILFGMMCSPCPTDDSDEV